MREVRGQGQHLLSLHGANLEPICLALAPIILLSFGEGMQTRVPFRFQRRGYESIIGIDTIAVPLFAI